MTAAPADAIPRTWVEHAPGFAQPYLRLMRLDRPIGTWLLFWPCVFGLALGGAGQAPDIVGDLRLIALFAIGSIVMRGAGCTYNDIVDRDIDAQVARTRGRPLPSGAVSLRAAWIFLALQLATGLAVLLALNRFSIALGASSLVLVAIYPFMKRVTWWPQAWLGLTFNWGALLGFAAKTGHLALPAFLLYAALLLLDARLRHDLRPSGQGRRRAYRREIDGAPVRHAIQTLDWNLLPRGTAPVSRRRRTINLGFGILLLGAGAHLLWQVRRLDIDNPALCLKIFRANRDIGAIIALAYLVGAWLPGAV